MPAPPAPADFYTPGAPATSPRPGRSPGLIAGAIGGAVLLVAAAAVGIVLVTRHPQPAAALTGTQASPTAATSSTPSTAAPTAVPSQPAPTGSAVASTGATYSAVVTPTSLNGEAQDNDPTVQTALSSIQTQLSSGSHVTNAVTGAYGPSPDLILMAAALYDGPLDVTSTINNNSSGLQDSNGNNINESNATQVTENGQTYYCWDVALNSSQNAEMCEWVDGNVNGIVLDINSTNANHVATIADEARTHAEQL